MERRRSVDTKKYVAAGQHSPGTATQPLTRTTLFPSWPMIVSAWTMWLVLSGSHCSGCNWNHDRPYRHSALEKAEGIPVTYPIRY